MQKKVFIVSLLLGFLACPATLVWAADFGLSSDKKTYEVGDTIAVKVVLASPKEASNAISGVVSFSNDKLQVSSISKSGSVVNMWVQEPAYYNADGQVNFEGVILNPGFRGGAGTVLTINFKARSAGTAKISFANGSILANDGAGTNILGKLGQASFSIIPASTKPIVEKKSTPISVPTKTLIATSTADIVPPEQLALIEVESSNPKRAKFSFSAQDFQSGLNYYEINIDGSTIGRLSASADTYETLNLPVGSHQFKLIAFDKAGNQAETSVDFNIAAGGFGSLVWPGLDKFSLSVLLAVALLIVVLIIFLLFILLKNLRRLFLLEKELAQVRLPASAVDESLKTYQESLPSMAKIIFRGQAEETQAVVLLRNGQIVAETKPGADQQFEFALDNLPAGFQHFAVVAVEALGNPTLTQDYPVMLSAGSSIVVSGVKVSKLPTFVSKAVDNSIQKDFQYREPNV